MHYKKTIDNVFKPVFYIIPVIKSRRMKSGEGVYVARTVAVVGPCRVLVGRLTE